jgi:transposase (troncated ?)
LGPDEDPHRRVEATGGALGPLETGVDILGYQPTPPGSDRMEIVAMDGLAGYKTGAVEDLPDAVTVMGSFHDGSPVR